MDKSEYELILADRIGVIRSANEKYDLEGKAYLSFSGGKDSTVLHHLLDIALPGNRIPRVFIDTGIEYEAIREFVASMAESDDRFVTIKPSRPIKAVLQKYGYPFKSKEHSLKVGQWQSGSRAKSVLAYKEGFSGYGKSRFQCPKALLYQYGPEFRIKLSDQCCHKLKKEPAKKWAKENGRSIVMTGMRRDEGGQRKNLSGCIITGKGGEVKKFHPLLVVPIGWEDEFVRERGIRLCRLYYEPYGFERTGCKGCPFALGLADQLERMARLMPRERAQCEAIWKPVYDEYRRIGFRLPKSEQIKLF